MDNKTLLSLEERQHVYLQFLKESGYECGINEHSEVFFKLDDPKRTFYIIFNEQDPAYTLILLPYIWDYNGGNFPDRFLMAANHATSQTKVAKIVVQEDQGGVDVMVEIMSNHWSIFSVFHRYQSAMLRAQNIFYEKMEELAEEGYQEQLLDDYFNDEFEDIEFDDVTLPEKTINYVTNPTLAKFKFNLTGWGLEEENDNLATWKQLNGDTCILTCVGSKPEFGHPPYDDLFSLRHLKRSNLPDSGGLVSLEIREADSREVIEIISKYKQAPHGMDYVGEIHLNEGDNSFKFEFYCKEGNTTGVRDTAIYKTLSKIGAVGNDKDSFHGWRVDPYDSDYDNMGWYNLSDNRRFDNKFPHHPLSRVRKYLKDLVESLEIN